MPNTVLVFLFFSSRFFRSHYASENHDLIDNSQKLKQVSKAAKSRSPLAAVYKLVLTLLKLNEASKGGNFHV